MTSTIPPGLPPTDNQRQYVDAIRKRLHLTEYLLDNHVVATYDGRHLRDLDRAGMSQLIDELLSWEGIPAAVMKAAGQRELWPGFGT